MSLPGSLLLLKGCRDRERPECGRAAGVDDSLLQITFRFLLFCFFCFNGGGGDAIILIVLENTL